MEKVTEIYKREKKRDCDDILRLNEAEYITTDTEKQIFNQKQI